MWTPSVGVARARQVLVLHVQDRFWCCTCKTGYGAARPRQVLVLLVQDKFVVAHAGYGAARAKQVMVLHVQDRFCTNLDRRTIWLGQDRAVVVCPKFQQHAGVSQGRCTDTCRLPHWCCTCKTECLSYDTLQCVVCHMVRRDSLNRILTEFKSDLFYLYSIG